jgi:hypothetical protein
MEDKLLGLKEVNEAVVLPDKPKAVYYVAVLVRRTTPHELSFFVDAQEDANQMNSLYAWHERDTKFREQRRESCLKQLRAEAHWVPISEDSLKRLAPDRRRDLE